ncbi:FmdB family zinc ribbon protein [Williamsia soli]|uniref:FmdB family zinc ribbon protein n=1 Tax=Williamsia soli TaxID=364929 RepID=UPI001A9DDD6D|nr:FmdB family zinc ribbon protein [Williamsia soli]
MPTYSYACTQCDNRFDIVQSFTDDSLTECPQCAGKLRKLFNSVGIVFKGSGFYRNDSRSASSSSEAGSSSSDSSSKSDSGSKDSGSKDSGSKDKAASTSKSSDSSSSSSSSSSSTAKAAS